ncbi:RICIN domain-containing protein [Hoeflea sp. BAL378]|uniref:RICIN domain-containing protein n=1 Tax=Hoeflea sp. BAL378 TaxID=1547437 RepID=UPI000692180D|nr:RICIN domain-containing protein [Hoeflea sp. BAL378]
MHNEYSDAHFANPSKAWRKSMWLALGMFASLVISAPSSAQAQEFDDGQYYRLTTEWQGDGKSLDVVNDGANDQLILADTGDYSGQYWKFTSVGDGFYRLTTQWQGAGKSLDVVNDGTNEKLILADTGNYSGQNWRVERQANGYYRMTTQWQGAGKSLDVVNDGVNNQVRLAPTGDYSGQYWKIVAQ